MSDDHQRDDRPAAQVTSVSLRAERLRLRLAKAAGAKVDSSHPGLSKAPVVRDPELTNRYAVWALVAGIVALFLSTFYIASAAAFVLCFFAWRRAGELRQRGKQPWGRRRTIWAFWFAVFGVAQYSYGLFIVPLFQR